MSGKPASPDRSFKRGKLRIGNDWNAITIIALSQSNPLKAVAELVENSIDARATSISITRGRSEGHHYLEIRDDGQGIPRDEEGRPDFRYVATHICDSVKRRLKVEGVSGLQGEFGIGLLSFWTLGEELTLTSTADDDRAWQMIMRRGSMQSNLPYDRSRRRVETDLTFVWDVIEGSGALEHRHDQVATFIAPGEPGLARVKVSVSQDDIERSAEALITVTREVLSQTGTTMVESQGLPGYTFESAPGESWRSRYDASRNVIIINNGHRDFVYVARTKVLKLRYLIRLYAKELVLKNFVGLPPDQLLERMVELSLRTEENL